MLVVDCFTYSESGHRCWWLTALLTLGVITYVVVG